MEPESRDTVAASTHTGPSSRIRLARSADIACIQEIETAAGRLFAEIGMVEVAEDDPPSSSILADYIRSERAWIAETNGRLAAYALVEVVDGAAHLEQVSVHPDYGRQGLGRELIEIVVNWARARQFPYLTLLTFGDVPWNGPYYERLGFRVVPDSELPPELRARREHERDLGLDVRLRQAMRLHLDNRSR